MPNTTPEQIATFISRWENSGGAERSNYVLFLTQLCRILDVPEPDPKSPDPTQDAYVIERDVWIKQPDGSTRLGRIDLYKRRLKTPPPSRSPPRSWTCSPMPPPPIGAASSPPSSARC